MPTSIFTALIFSLIHSVAVAAPRGLIDGRYGLSLSLKDVASRVSPGSIVVLGENHDNDVHSAQQLEFLRALRAMGLKVSVGMEFLEYPAQSALDAYLKDEITEDEFLRAAQWGGSDYAHYREQIRFPLSAEGWTYALNAPRSVTAKVARGGLESLSAADRALLPPNFTRGNDDYFARFREIMGGHGPSDEAVERYFLAQSVWDDTMAWKALKALDADPSQVLVIIVGEFHVQYGGGLPDRLRARGAGKVLTLSQMNVQGLTPVEVDEAISATGPYGPRADFLWVSEF